MHIFKLPLAFFTSLILFSITCTAQTYSGSQEDINQILKNIDAFSGFYMNEDYDKLANSYAKDAKILPPGADIIEGRKAIKQRWTLPEGVDIPLHKITPIEIKVIGNYAYDVGYYNGQSKRANTEIVDFKGKYIIVWKKQDGDWKIYLDMWNSVED